MSNGMTVDERGNIRSTRTGQFLAVPVGVAKMRVNGGWLFVNEREPREDYHPTDSEKARWGEFA